MYDLGLFVLSMSPAWVLFWIAVIVVVMFVLKAWAAGILLLAVFLYNVTVWTASPPWLKDIFWIAVLVTVIALAFWAFTKKPMARTVAMGGAGSALLIAIFLMTHLFGLVDNVSLKDGKVDTPSVGVTNEDVLGDQNDIRQKNVDAINEVRDDINEDLGKEADRITELEGQVDGLKTRLDEMQGQIDAIQQLMEDHQHEVVKQPHYVEK